MSSTEWHNTQQPDQIPFKISNNFHRMQLLLQFRNSHDANYAVHNVIAFIQKHESSTRYIVCSRSRHVNQTCIEPLDHLSNHIRWVVPVTTPSISLSHRFLSTAFAKPNIYKRTTTQPVTWVLRTDKRLQQGPT